MESLYLLIPIGIVFVVIAVKILFWAINSGQYDNLDTEAHRILFDEQVHPSNEQDNSAEEGKRSGRQSTPERHKGDAS